ncbi:MAG TPA: LysR family transcriptional regulator [Candidatus Acidoferrales bacterium]|jgi:LysR family carnitine catabolism transcriptional activator|nr:LysR family transcriptional regulator [Candidatus Acidoferrales bacterium]
MEFTSRQLKAFQLVAQHRSFTRAAEALFITPSGLSVLIRELEKQLGFRLFNRTTRHVALSAYGNELLAVTRRSLRELEAAMSQIGRTAEDASQVLSVGAPPLVATNILPQAIREFRGQRPDVRIELFDANLTTIVQRVEAGKLDMGLGIFRNTPGIRRTPFFRFSLMVIRADKEAALHRISTTWSALKGETLVSLPPASPVQLIVDKHLAEAEAVCRRGAVVNSLDTQIALVEADVGIAIIPSFGLPACRNRKVVMSRLINPVVNLEFYQISNRGKKLPAAADEFSAFLKNYIARWAGRAGVL